MTVQVQTLDSERRFILDTGKACGQGRRISSPSGCGACRMTSFDSSYAPLWSECPTDESPRCRPPCSSRAFACPFWEYWERFWPIQLVRIIARIPALTGSGRVGQARKTACKSGSFGTFCAPTAPDSAPLWSEVQVFFAFCEGGSSPFASTSRTLVRIPQVSFFIGFATGANSCNRA